MSSSISGKTTKNVAQIFIMTMPVSKWQAQTTEHLMKKNIEFLSHCPYSPDLLPYVFLFPNVKQKISGQRFFLKKLMNPYKSIFIRHLQDEAKCCGNKFQRMQKFINLQGKYFGKKNSLSQNSIFFIPSFCH